MHVGTDFLKLPPVTGQYWSLFQCSMLGTGGTCERSVSELATVMPWVQAGLHTSAPSPPTPHRCRQSGVSLRLPHPVAYLAPIPQDQV